MAAYCAESDLVIGNIPTPSYLNVAQKIQDAADEIDSRIGYIYTTPIDVSNGSAVARPARLFLKRLNAHLASGRIILAVASPEENRNLHAYGYSLVRDSLLALDQIAAGEIPLPGATPAEGGPTEAQTIPLIANVDSESNVEAFYDRIANPNFVFSTPLGRPNPDRFVW